MFSILRAAAQETKSALKTTVDNLATKMSNANYIKTVTKISNIGYDNPQGTSENDCKLFILSVKEIGLISEHGGSSTDAISINSESKFTYQYFENITKISEFATERWFWLRTATTDRGDCFRLAGKDNKLHTDYAYFQYGLLPAFVIG